jgi:Putative undecaprenyl diphosphate synthase
MMPTAPLDAGDHLYPSVSTPSTPRQPCKDATSTHAGGRRRKSFHQHGSDQLHPMMSLLQCAYWLRDKAIDRIRRVLLGVLKAGPVPHHVAFIMDGNRRYARNKGVKVIQGHVDGFAALRRVRAQNRLCTVYELHQKKFFFWGATKPVTDTGNMLLP